MQNHLEMYQIVGKEDSSISEPVTGIVITDG